jgi:hypothetical protein
VVLSAENLGADFSIRRWRLIVFQRSVRTTMSSPFPHLLGASLLALTTLLVGCASSPKLPPLRTVPFVDLERYTGRWYVIANIPYFLERGKVASYDTYARRPDGTFTNDFTFRRGTFDAQRSRSQTRHSPTLGWYASRVAAWSPHTSQRAARS